MVEYYNGEEVVEFITQCPVDGCDNYEEIHWVHSGCGEKEYINSDGIIICSKCGDRTRFFDRKFKCQKHGDYKPPSRDGQRLIAAFSNLVPKTQTKKFIRALMFNLLEQYDD